MITLRFEELDDTRAEMLAQFHAEWSKPERYEPKLLTEEGIAVWPEALETAIKVGNEVSLFQSMAQGRYWKGFDARGAIVNIPHRCEQLSVDEFNTWYVRALSARLIAEGVDECEVYRAGPADVPDLKCSRFQGKAFSVQEVFDGHRRRYHPVFDKAAFAIPYHTGCHHTIRRIK